MATYAPENIKLDVPTAPTLADWLAEAEPGQINLGPNINWEKVPSNLLNLLTLSDPSGMIGGPAGIVLKYSPEMGILSRFLRGGERGLAGKSAAINEFLGKFPGLAKAIPESYPIELTTAKELNPGTNWLTRLFQPTVRAEQVPNLIRTTNTNVIPHELFHEFISQRDPDLAFRKMFQTVGESLNRSPDARKVLIRAKYGPFHQREEILAGLTSLLGEYEMGIPKNSASLAAVKKLKPEDFNLLSSMLKDYLNR